MSEDKRRSVQETIAEARAAAEKAYRDSGIATGHWPRPRTTPAEAVAIKEHDSYDEKSRGPEYRRGVADGRLAERAFTGPPLHVPEQAIVNFDETLGLLDQHGGVAAALHVIAAPMVAAELRRLAALGGAGILDLLARAEELEAT